MRGRAECKVLGGGIGTMGVVEDEEFEIIEELGLRMAVVAVLV